MREHPILFNDEMVRAILDGRKTQTRRKDRLGRVNANSDSWRVDAVDDDGCAAEVTFCSREYPVNLVIQCPYGGPGDRLWVQEHRGSLITLEILEVRVERVQDITATEAQAEGVQSVLAFENLWNQINEGKLDWTVNPWVWVITFRRLEDEG